MTECCKFCGGEDLRPDLIEIGALPGGRLYLHRDQTHPGRVILVADRHVKKVTDLSLPEYKALMESVYHTAQAITDQFSQDKINYLIFGDTCMFILYLNIKTGRIGAKFFLLMSRNLFFWKKMHIRVSALICVVGLD